MSQDAKGVYCIIDGFILFKLPVVFSTLFLGMTLAKKQSLK